MVKERVRINWGDAIGDGTTVYKETANFQQNL